jgi:hypothetical protein
MRKNTLTTPLCQPSFTVTNLNSCKHYHSMLTSYQQSVSYHLQLQLTLLLHSSATEHNSTAALSTARCCSNLQCAERCALLRLVARAPAAARLHLLLLLTMLLVLAAAAVVKVRASTTDHSVLNTSLTGAVSVVHSRLSDCSAHS